MKTKSTRMYENPVLHALSFSTPKMMLVFHTLAILSMLVVGYLYYYKFMTLAAPVLLFMGGIMTWSLAEYMLHRYVFHFETENKIVRAVHYALHGHHHNHPRDSDHLFMPPVPASILLLIFFGLFYLVMGNRAWFFLPGFESGYLLYSLLHYRIHTGQPPKHMRKLWHHHIIHHYQQPEKAFGVSTRFWDRIFKTMPDYEKK